MGIADNGLLQYFVIINIMKTPLRKKSFNQWFLVIHYLRNSVIFKS